MKTKIILLFVFYSVFILTAHCQSKSHNKEYRKFRLSTNAGLDFPLGNSNTVLHSSLIGNFTLPNSSSGFGISIDGAYFFTKNYGIGVKYHFYTSDGIDETVKPDEIYEMTYQKLTFNEKTHFVGPTAHARCFLFNSKLEFSANMGIVFLYNKLSKVTSEIKRPYPTEVTIENWWIYGENVSFDDNNGTTFGFTASTGICYKITSTLGVGLRADVFFSSLSSNDYIHRRINRIGISAEININF